MMTRSKELGSGYVPRSIIPMPAVVFTAAVTHDLGTGRVK